MKRNDKEIPKKIALAKHDISIKKLPMDGTNAIRTNAGQKNIAIQRATELTIANKELALQRKEKAARAAEFLIAIKELAFQNEEKDKRAAELLIANTELAFQNVEKDKRAAELLIANKELAFQNEEKDKRAAELLIANKELAFQNEEKDKRAAELLIANTELAFQTGEKANRAAELIIANKELIFQTGEKADRAAELIIANKELAFQTGEKADRAAELIIANKELAFQSDEKANRAAELIIADQELLLEGREKAKRALQTDELREQNFELEMQKKILAEASLQKSTFLSNMSHEIRTPINAIVGFTELALKTNLTPKQFNYLNKIKTSSHTLLGLISDVLDLSKIEAGKLELESALFSINDVLQNVINQVSTKAQEKELKLLLSIDTKVPSYLSGDALRLEQILMNLTSNAVKFTKEGEILIRVELAKNSSTNTMLQFSVKDTGIGLSKEQINKLFQPFTQADTSTTRKYGGTGLGLSISQNLVNLMNGEIWVESAPGSGSTFFFTIENNIDDKERFNHFKDLFGKWEMKVLVVADQEVDRKAITGMLEDLSLTVTTSSSGEEAVALFEKAKGNLIYDLVIVDKKMPGMSGIETTKRIKKIFEAGKAPAIILITAYGSDGVQKKTEQAESLCTVLYKPFTPSLLFNMIVDVCGKDDYETSVKHLKMTNKPGYLPIFSGVRILLVEDNEINREVAQEILSEAAFIVTVAFDGKEAVEKVHSGHFDVVLMDIQMPIMDGYDATREIRKNPALAELPIIAMTANALLSDKEKCLQAGMNDHIAKPIDTRQLFQKIAFWTKTLPGEAPRSIALGTFESTVATDSTLQGATKTNHLAGLDAQAGLDRLGGNKKLFNSLLAKFGKNHKGAISEIKTAIAGGDIKAAEIIAHTIKGASGNVGLRDVYNAANALESEYRVNRGKEATLLLQQLNQTLEQAFASIDFLKNTTGNERDLQASAEILSQQSPRWDELRKLLLSNNMNAVDCVEEIVQQSQKAKLAQKTLAMKESIDRYDFEGALVILDEIRSFR
jgi:signal transduction histidine kinase/DNA-binding response OmpR family regulator